MTSLREKLTLGAVWTVSFRILIRFMGVISTAILARLLVPADFGLVTLAATTIAVASAFSEFSPDQYLLTHRSESQDYDTAWTLQIIRGLAIWALMFAGASQLGLFFNEPRLELVIRVLSIGILIRSFANVGIVDFRKELDFKRDFLILLIPKLLGFITTIALALYLRNYWALIFGLMIGHLTHTVASFAMHDFRPKLGLGSIRKMFRFSKWMFTSSALQFILQKFDTFLIGRLLGAQTLGFYSISYELSTIATSELAAPIRRAVLPGYSKIANDRQAFKILYLDVFSLTVMITVPIAAGIMATSDLIVLTLLGEMWVDAIPIIEIVTIVGGLQAIGSGAGPLFLASKCPEKITAIMFGTMILQIPLMLWSIEEFGVQGVAWALVAAWVWRQFLSLYFVMQIIKTSFIDHTTRIWRSVVSALAMYVAVVILRGWLPTPSDTLISAAELLTCMMAGVSVFSVIQFALWLVSGKPTGPETHGIRIFTLLLGKLRGGGPASNPTQKRL